jgi:integrase
MVSDHIAIKDDDTAPANVESFGSLTVFRAPSRPDISRDELLAAARLLRKDSQHGSRDYRPLMELFIDRLQTLPGRNWQERWDASGAEQILGAGSWANAFPGLQKQATAISTGPGMGVSLLISVDALRPSAQFLARNGRIRLGSLLPWSSTGLEEANAEYYKTRTKTPANGRRALWVIQAATGKHLTEITSDDLIGYARLVDDKQVRAAAGVAWELLKILQIVPADAPSMHQLAYRGRRNVAQVVEFYGIQPQAIADMFIRYLRTREPSMDYSSLRSLSYELLRNFWIPISERNPGQNNLHISPELGRWWKREFVTQRADTHRTLFMVRALYRDIASWATQDAYWAGWAAPSFLTHADTTGAMKHKRRVQAEIHQRIRRLTPELPRLIESIDRDSARQMSLLEVAKATKLGGRFEFEGVDYTRLARPLSGFSLTSVPIRIESSGEVISQARSADRAFWAWAAAHVLHETGIRIEELLELTATALFTYAPANGERLLLLQIVPSKSDRERVLLVSPELAHVLATIRQKIQEEAHQVPLAVRYDEAEKVFSPPLPFLFQTHHRTNARVFSTGTIRTYLNYAVEVAGLGDGTKLTPHDFRRVFATDALRTGLPVHILAKVMGHLNLNTTQGYAAVFDEDVARHFREFVDRRRSLRPAEDYREPTPIEVEEFQEHFAKRKVELGSCSRSYGTPCIHEHACIRCPMLRPDPVQRHRLESIRANLVERRGEAARMGWQGELEGIEISLRAADEKLSQMSRIVRLTLERRPHSSRLGES